MHHALLQDLQDFKIVLFVFRETSNLEEEVKETEEENEGFKARMYQHFQSVIDWIKSGPPVERRKR
jgi:hypothetical protein